MFTSEELVASVGPFQPIAGDKVTLAQARTPEAWREIMCTKPFKWVGKRLAHIFEGGWTGASFEGAAKDGQKIFAEVSIDDEFTFFYCKDTAVSLVNDLKLEECGMHKAWVILEKENQWVCVYIYDHLRRRFFYK